MRKKYYQTEMDYRKTKRGYITRLVGRTKHKCRKEGIPYDLDVEYLLSITTDRCPVFKTEFVWSQGRGVYSPEGPSIDRVIPSLGYVKGNVVFISRIANTIKSNVTEKELYAVADWLHDERKKVINAFQGKLTPLPAAPDTPGRKNTEHRITNGPRPW